MRKLIMFTVLVILMFLGTAAFAQQNSWVDLPTGVDANGEVTTTNVFGHYSDLEGIGEVFIECDPDTGEEIGAYIPGAKIGDQKTYTEGESIKKETIDWDHPKEVLPIQVVLLAPNIPTGAEVDWDYYNQHGEIRRKTVNQFKWPTGTGFNKFIPGSDQDYWLFVVKATNPNPFSVSVNLSAVIYNFSDGNNEKTVNKNYQSLVMQPNETKYALLNRGMPGTYYRYLVKEWPQWNGNDWYSGYSTGYYSARISNITDITYPEILKTAGVPGYYRPDVRWNGTNPTVKPLIPMRLAYDIYIRATNDQDAHWYYYSYESVACKGREFPRAFCHMEYDPVLDKWNISVRFFDFDRPPNMSDEKWQGIVNTATNNAKTTLEFLFRTWYPKTPYWSVWQDNPVYINGETGEWYGFTYPNPLPNFYILFGSLEAVPPTDAPPAYDPSQGWQNICWGGWRYITGCPSSSGHDLTAPVLVDYRASNFEKNWAYVQKNYVSKGTSIVRTTDPKYYDTEWMNLMPVLKAEPMFIEKYAFHATDGDFGYMTKEAVPGYSLWVSIERRPVISDSTQPVRVYAKTRNFIDYKDDGYYKLIREWEWTSENGWQKTSETKESNQKYGGPSNGNADWYVEIKANHTFSGANTSDVPITWSLFSGNLCWGNAEKMSSKLTELADYILVNGNKQYLVDNISVNPVVPSSENPITLNAGESRTLFSADKTYTVNFKRGRNYLNWSAAQSLVLNEINTNVTSLINNVTEEAAFDNNAAAKIGKTFVDGQGGVICGAQKNLVHRYLKQDGWSSDYKNDIIGFAPSNNGLPLVPFVPGSTLWSYFNNGDYNSVVVKGSDEVLGAALAAGDGTRKININNSGKWNGGKVQAPFWKVYNSGKLYPPERL